MLRKLSPSAVQSDAGFSLCSGPKDYWIYSEGDRTIYVTREAAQFEREGWGEYIYLSSLPDSWLPPHNAYAISDRKREEIAANIRKGLRFLGVIFKAA
jgi:hypothetical protein